MRINTSWDRWVHLAVLCLFTALGAYALITWFEWKPLSALSLSCVFTLQVNNAIQMIMNGEIPGVNDDSLKSANAVSTGAKRKKRQRKED
mmetsp:Transcript_10017/g.18212  ORF Transcript_10017/g.18212 Transcript_10017/m.18212 type:complete len:90 (-) Transcript_10017:235-504(-)